ncbi:MAG: transporter ATP-binding protein [Mycobacterium sp.]|nr:transporter ATP-binding protein [Mycobacterium sp.]
MPQTTTERPVLHRDTESAVRLTGLTKRYGEVTAVNGLDLTIRPGEVVALLGPNGAGKSTTIDMMLGLTEPDAGAAAIYDLQPTRAIAEGRVGAMLQSGGLLPDLTVTEIVTLAASLYPRHRAIDEVLVRAGVTDFARQRVGRLSGGQQQRVRFAMALAADPDLIVLDEPTTGLDVEARRAFWTAMREETAHGRTVLFATHYLDEADAYADRIVLMRGGTIVADGPPNHIKSLVSGRTIRATIADADLNALAALPGVDRVETRGDTVLLHCADSDTALRAVLGSTPAHDIEVVARGLEDAFIALTSASAGTAASTEESGK